MPVKRYLSKTIIFLCCFFIAALFPWAADTPSQANVRAVCTGVAIDRSEKVENGYLVSAQILIPQPGGQYSQNLSMLSNDNVDLSLAFNQMEYQSGKKIRFAHCCFIIVSQSICDDNLTQVLDYFVRGVNFGNNTILLHTNDKAQELLMVSSFISNNEIDNLQTISDYNEKYLFSNGANLVSFYNDYLSPHKTSNMSSIKLNKENSSGSGGSGSSGGSGGSGGGSSAEGGGSSSGSGNTSQTQPEKVLNEGEVAIFYKGKCATVLDNEKRKQFVWLDPGIKENLVQISNVKDKTFDNATISFLIAAKKLNLKYEFVDKKPVIRANITLSLHLEYIKDENGQSLPSNSNYLTDAVVQAISDRVQNDLNSFMDISKEYGFDAFNFYHEFNLYQNKEWKEYLRGLDNPEDYMKEIQVYSNVTCRSIL